MHHHASPRPSHASARPLHSLHPLNLQIPSLHPDGLLLETTLHVPPYPPSTRLPRRAAILAHPYAPLGGTHHDPVITHVTRTLLSAQHVVATFNFRGAGRSRGRTTWSGKAETCDLAAVVAWVVAFMRVFPGLWEGEDVQVVVGGYSYGALVAAHCLDIRGVLEAPPKALVGAVEAAARCAERWYEVHSEARTSYSGVRGGEAGRTSLGGALRVEGEGAGTSLSGGLRTSGEAPVPAVKREIVMRYLLISPVLPPVALALMVPGLKGREKSALDVEVAKERAVGMLCIWGGQDVFTGVKRYRRWKEKMERGWDGFVGVEVQEAGHFWGERDIAVIEERVREWVGGF